MTFKQVFQYLLDNKFVMILSGKPVFTLEFEKKYEEEGKDLRTNQAVVTVQQLVKADSLKELWNKFIADAQIPHRTTSPEGRSYTIRHYTQAASRKLKQIIATVDYDRLVACTKNYYMTTSYKKTLQNYLIDDTWEGEYQEWKGQTTKVADGSSKWED